MRRILLPRYGNPDAFSPHAIWTPDRVSSLPRLENDEDMGMPGSFKSPKGLTIRFHDDMKPKLAPAKSSKASGYDFRHVECVEGLLG